MKLVLLLGMDGTGNLFSPLIQAPLGIDSEVIALPDTGDQDYSTIIEFVKDRLPKKNFILIAESFAGPIGAAIAKENIENLKGIIIFVATFLSTPNKLLLAVAQFLPLKLLSTLPFAKYFHKTLFLGSNASNELMDLFQSTVRSLPSTLIKARLNSINSLVYSPDKIDLPVAYIQATSDKLVPSSKVKEFKRCFSNIIIKTIEGPHFILQAQPTECAVVINQLTSLLKMKLDAQQL